MSTDNESYNGADSGCKAATEKLGRQSPCLECPFPECVLIGGLATYSKKVRNAQIIRMSKTKTLGEIAVEMGLSWRHVLRIISGR